MYADSNFSLADYDAVLFKSRTQSHRMSAACHRQIPRIQSFKLISAVFPASIYGCDLVSGCGYPPPTRFPAALSMAH